MNSSGTILIDQNKLKVIQERPYNSMVISIVLEIEKGTIADSSHTNCVILYKSIVP